MKKFLIVGLGNVGQPYLGTRHNIGFEVLDKFVEAHHQNFKSGHLAAVAKFDWQQAQIVCIKPDTYMNLSGKSFFYWLGKTQTPLEDTLTIVDDLSLPIPKIRLKPAGSHSGHNGLKNIQLLLNTTEYPKLRMGIGNDFPAGRQADFVLSKWRTEEKKIIEHKTQVAVDIINAFIQNGIDKTMNDYNHLSF